MAKFQMQGINQYIDQLRKLEKGTDTVCKAAIYAGAGVLADGIKDAIEDLDTVSDAKAKAAWREGQPTKISVQQKAGLVQSMGVTPIRDKFGNFDAKIGFDGYNNIKTERWPNGQPNALIARACESGTSAMLKQPFIRPTEKRLKNAVYQAMDEAADKETQKIIGG